MGETDVKACETGGRTNSVPCKRCGRPPGMREASEQGPGMRILTQWVGQKSWRWWEEEIKDKDDEKTKG